MRKVSLLESLIIDWYQLFENSRDYCLYGEDDDFYEPIDFAAFKKCMKEAYQYFFEDNERPQNLTPKEIEVYGVIFAYSQLEMVGIDEEADKFNASTLVAEEMANSIRDSQYNGLDGTRLIGLYIDRDGKTRKYEYDIETGDFSDFIDYAGNVL